MDNKRQHHGTSLYPEYKVLLKSLASDLRKDTNLVIEEALEMYANKNKHKSGAYYKFKEKR